MSHPADEEPPNPCTEFWPDHNGECLHCDEWLDAHTPAAVAAGEQRAARTYQQYQQYQPPQPLVRTSSTDSTDSTSSTSSLHRTSSTDSTSSTKGRPRRNSPKICVTLPALMTPVSEEQRIAFGCRPRTLAGWWFWLRYWSPLAFWWAKRAERKARPR